MFIYKVLYTFTCFVCIQLLIKSDSVIKAIDSALYDLDNIETGDIPLHLKDAHYSGAKNLGRGVGYKYPHNYAKHYVKQQYLPDSISDKVYYNHGNNKNELTFKHYWDNLKKQFIINVRLIN